MKKLLIMVFLVLVGIGGANCGTPGKITEVPATEVPATEVPAKVVEVSMDGLEKMLKAEGFNNWLLNYYPDKGEWRNVIELSIKSTGGTLIKTYSPEKFISFIRSAPLQANINVYFKESPHRIEKTYLTSIGGYDESVYLMYVGIYEYSENGIPFKIIAHNFYKVIFSSK